ncbi:zinc ribbon domain-containing protein [Butyrivibrio fibrisolvens]|uniref:zinc ribbon domain-containing protein n=1 Tax=Butyrivibrio fibrisolvens TaxID=831 RepID=UPI000403261F|nr:zinc ribbon domain-containing protein [Butyrivibrio fibrisolvens]
MDYFGKFCLLFGGFWLLISVAVLVPLAITLGGSDPDSMLFIALFMLLFFTIGGVFFGIGLKQLFKRNKILKKGTTYYAKIVAYEEDSRILVNGRPLNNIVVRYYDKCGRMNNATVSPNGSVKGGFPLGGTVEIVEYEGETILKSKKAVNMKIQGEENLMMSYNGGAVSVDQIRPESYYCPHCGANLMIPRGQTVKCPYCDSFVTNTRQFA